MKIIRNLLLLLIPVILYSCNNSEKKSSDTPEVQINKLFVQFPDAKKWMPDWSKEDVVVYHWLSDPSYLHPANFKFQNARVILQLTQGFLLGIDQMHKGLVPLLVKSLPEVSADQLQFTYELLDDATWDDGTPITVEDVISPLKQTSVR